MKKVIARALALVGAVAAGATSIGCVIFFIDEPAMPKSLIEN